jgi:mRNA interferase MazF
MNMFGSGSCPVTSHVKSYPFEATVPPGLNVRGAILADHLKNLGWRQRQAQKAGKIPRAILEQVRERTAALPQIA